MPLNITQATEPPHANQQAEFRVYEELNDFLPAAARKTTLAYRFRGSPSVKDAIEAQGAPHPEVDIIVVDGVSVNFAYKLRDGDRVAVYPVFESFDISPLVKLRERPLRDTRFVVDVNLGKLARLLRILGFDTLYSNQYQDRDVAEIAAREHRIVLTRDRGLLRARIITLGYWVRRNRPEEQVREVIQRFDLSGHVAPFKRCAVCNSPIQPVEKAAIIERLEPKTKRYYDQFFICRDCGKLYWEGSHLDNLRPRLASILGTG